MCSLCSTTLKGFGIPHAESVCPLRNSLYCSTCARYGHSLNDCYAKPSRFFTEPAFVEQLLNPSDLKRYNITTQTPLPPHPKEEPPRYLEIQDNDRVIAAYLAARSFKIQKGFTKKQALEEYAKGERMRVLYIR